MRQVLSAEAAIGISTKASATPKGGTLSFSAMSRYSVVYAPCRRRHQHHPYRRAACRCLRDDPPAAAGDASVSLCAALLSQQLAVVAAPGDADRAREEARGDAQ